MQPNSDQRWQNTEIAIHQAFEAMLAAGIRPIQVTALTQRAKINRKTFYAHYETINDLSRAYIEQIKTSLYTLLRQHTAQEYLTQSGLLTQVLTDFFMANDKIYRNLLFQDEYFIQVQQVQTEIVQTLAKHFAHATGKSNDDALLMVIYLAGPLLSLLKLQAQGILQLSPVALQAKISAITTQGLKKALDLPL